VKGSNKGKDVWSLRALTPPGKSEGNRGVQDPDLRTRIRQDSAHFEQTGSDQDHGFIQVSGSGSGVANFIFGI